jgi:tetratricopeptide (TPR) repeat protein
MSIVDRIRGQEAVVRINVRGRRGATWPARIVLAAILLSLVSTAQAEVDQEVDRINQEVARLVEKGWYGDAMVLAEKAVELAEPALPEEHPVLVEALSNLAGVCRRTDDPTRAQALYEKVLAVKEKSLGPTHPDLAKSLDDLAAVHKAARSYDEAEALYRRALEIREEALGPDDPKLVGPLIDLGGLYQIRQDYPQADALLKRAIEIQERTLGPNHPELVTPLKFRAAVCHAQEDYACSKTLLERALEIEREAARLLPPADAARGAIGISVWASPSASGAVGGKGRMAAAKVYFIRTDDAAEPYAVADRIWSNYSWGEQESLAYRATDLVESNFSQKGDVYLFNAEPGRYLAVGALFIYTSPGQTVAYHGYFSPEIIARSEVTVRPGQVVFMGDVEATMRGTPDPVQRFFYDFIPQPDAPVIDAPGYGSVHYRQDPQWTQLNQLDRGGKSEIAFWNRTRKAVKNETTWLGLIPDRDAIGDSAPAEAAKFAQKSQRALDKRTDGAYIDAVASAEDALKICESLPDAESVCLASALGNLADILTAKREHKRAEPLYSRALELRERRLGPEHPAVACTLNSMAEMSFLNEDLEKAQEHAQRALGIFEEFLGHDHPAVADTLAFLAQMHAANQDDEQAEALMERALRIREDALGWTHPTVAPMLHFLAEQSLSKAGYDRAAELSERALAIDKRVFGESHRNVAAALYTLAQAYHGLEDYERAVASLERALSIQRDVLGSKDQRIIDTMTQLAATYEKQGEGDKARRLLYQADELAQQKAMSDLDAIGKAMVNYAIDEGDYPTISDIKALKKLLHPTYIRSMSVKDGWGNDYLVKSDAEGYELRSLGKDGRPDSGGAGATSTFKADIAFANGQFAQWPEGPQQ